MFGRSRVASEPYGADVLGAKPTTESQRIRLRGFATLVVAGAITYQIVLITQGRAAVWASAVLYVTAAIVAGSGVWAMLRPRRMTLWACNIGAVLIVAACALVFVAPGS
jgi:hypothetical protein